jgi:hypothetical protein
MTEDESLALDFQALHDSIRLWFEADSVFREWFEGFASEYLIPEGAASIPAELTSEFHRLSANRACFGRTILAHAPAVMLFADRNSIDMKPMIRLLRNIEHRADDPLDKAAIYDCLEAAQLRYISPACLGYLVVSIDGVTVKRPGKDSVDFTPATIKLVAALKAGKAAGVRLETLVESLDADQDNLRKHLKAARPKLEKLGLEVVCRGGTWTLKEV